MLTTFKSIWSNDVTICGEIIRSKPDASTLENRLSACEGSSDIPAFSNEKTASFLSRYSEIPALSIVVLLCHPVARSLTDEWLNRVNRFFPFK